MQKMATTLFTGLHFPRIELNKREGDRRVHQRRGRVQADCGPVHCMKVSQASSHPTQCRNMPAVELFTYPQNDSGVGNKCKSMSRQGEIWANAAASDVGQAGITYSYDGLVLLANYMFLKVYHSCIFS